MSIKLVYAHRAYTLTHPYADDVRCHDRGFATHGATRYTIVILVQRNHSRILRDRQACIFKRTEPSVDFHHAHFEDSCYTRRDFTRLMHSCTYPSRRFRIGKHCRARRDIIGTMESGCVFSCHSPLAI